MNRRSRAALAATITAVVVFTASCSDDDTASDNTLATAASTVESPTTTVATTDAPTTTSATSAVAPTTEAPTTTVDPDQRTKRQVRRAVREAREAYVEALKRPRSERAVELIRDTSAAGSPARRQGMSYLETFRENGWWGREHPSIEERAYVEGEVEILGPRRARATVCTVSSGVVYEPDAGPNGQDVIVNDEVVARRSIETLVREDGVWKMSEGEPVDEWAGEAECLGDA